MTEYAAVRLLCVFTLLTGLLYAVMAADHNVYRLRNRATSQRELLHGMGFIYGLRWAVPLCWGIGLVSFLVQWAVWGL